MISMYVAYCLMLVLNQPPPRPGAVREIPAVEAASLATIPAKRYGRVEEFADVVCFLASERAAYVTGATIAVDGGATRGLL